MEQNLVFPGSLKSLAWTNESILCAMVSQIRNSHLSPCLLCTMDTSQSNVRFEESRVCISLCVPYHCRRWTQSGQVARISDAVCWVSFCDWNDVGGGWWHKRSRLHRRFINIDESGCLDHTHAVFALIQLAHSLYPSRCLIQVICSISSLAFWLCIARPRCVNAIKYAILYFVGHVRHKYDTM